MCLLWSTKCVLISQKTTFFTVTAVKRHILHRDNFASILGIQYSAWLIDLLELLFGIILLFRCNINSFGGSIVYTKEENAIATKQGLRVPCTGPLYRHRVTDRSVALSDQSSGGRTRNIPVTMQCKRMWRLDEASSFHSWPSSLQVVWDFALRRRSRWVSNRRTSQQ
jgi:hypothetical protein